MASTDDKGVEQRRAIRLGPAGRALFALLRESPDGAAGLDTLSPGRSLSFPILWIKASDIGKTTKRLRPFSLRSQELPCAVETSGQAKLRKIPGVTRAAAKRERRLLQ